MSGGAAAVVFPVTNLQFLLLGDAGRQKAFPPGVEAGHTLRKKQDTSQSLRGAPLRPLLPKRGFLS
jgi:hypothetical protein